MPLIRLEFDDNKVSDKDAESLSKAVRDIVSETTKIEDVFVYANSARVKVQIAPIEIFIQMTAKKIADRKELIGEIKRKIVDWKLKNNFQTTINLTLIPMEWNIEIGI